jgi:aminoglycoside phosphotransferase (APT) family kinase protein
VTTERSEPVGTEAEDPVPSDRLAAYLANTKLAAGLPIHSIELIGEGQSNLTFRIQLESGPVILRRPPLGPLPPKAHDVLREFRVMNSLRRSEVPVPRLFLSCDDPAIIGAPFYIMEDLPGDAIRFELPAAYAGSPGAPRLIAQGTVDALATLHTTDPDSIGLGNLGKPSGYLARQLRLWKGQLDYARVRPVPDLDWTSEWLERALPPDVERPSIVHGDYKLDNIIFSAEPPPRILGIVDWEMATLGDPLADLGWLLAFWCENGTPPAELKILPRITEDPRFPSRAELADRYAERVGRTLPDLRFYVVLALWKMAILLEAHWARHVRGTAGTFDFTYLEAGGPALAAYVRNVAEHGGFLSHAESRM